MPIKDATSGTRLRERAIALAPGVSSDIEQMSLEEIRRMVHELQVHQIELELQNEELREAQIKLSESRDRFTALYDFAPVGYVTLAGDMRIIEANLTAAGLFGMNRGQLLGQRFNVIVASESQDALFISQLAAREEGSGPCSFELLLRRGSDSTFAARMDLARIPGDFEGGAWLGCAIVDITECKDAESALRQSELRLRGLIEAIPDTVQFKDAAGAWKVANKPALKLFGLEGVDWKGQTDQELAARVPSIRHELELCAASDALVEQGGEIVRTEERVAQSDGSERIIEVTKLPLRKSDGRSDGLVVLGHDITERKETEEKIRAMNVALEQTVLERTHALDISDEMFRSVYKYAPIGVAIIDFNDHFVQCNPAYCKIVGQNEASLLGLPFSSFVQAEGLGHYLECIQRLRCGLISSFEMEHGYVREDGEPMWVYNVAALLHCKGGQGPRMIVLVSDITVHRRMREELQRSEHALGVFFDKAPIGLLWMDPQGRILRCNQTLCNIVGISGEGAIGHYFHEFDLANELSATIEILGNLGTIRNQRIRLRLKDRSIAHVLVDAVTIYEGGVLIRTDWFIRDISLRVDLERKVLEASEQERQKIGHELHDNLGQILHGASFMASELSARMEESGIAEGADLNRITDYLSQAMALVRGLSNGLQPVLPLPDGLIDALRVHVDHIKSIYGVTCRFDCPESVEVADPAIASHLFRIAQEALINAVKHSECEHIRIEIHRVNRGLVLSVSDDGRGRTPSSELDTGMGLKVMQFRAHAIHGSLIVQSGPHGVGTEVVCKWEPGDVDAMGN